MSRVAFVFACGAALISCSPGQGGPTHEAGTLVQIEGYAIRPSPPRHDVTQPVDHEVFGCGGMWSSRGRSGQRSGTYRVDGDRICVRTSGGEDCRRFIRRGADYRDVFLSGPLGIGEVEYSAQRRHFCAADPSGGPSRDATIIDVTGLPPLRDGELRGVLAGSSVMIGHFVSTYDCRGGWGQSGAIVPEGGTYEISGDQVCVTSNDRTSCARYFRQHGGYYVQAVREGVTTAGAVDIVRNERC